MSDPLAAAKLKAETAYNAAADYYDAKPLGFWARYGRRTVERLRLRHGAGCCGRWRMSSSGSDLRRDSASLNRLSPRERASRTAVPLRRAVRPGLA